MMLLWGAPLDAFAQQPTRGEVDQLKRVLEQQEQSIRELKNRIKELESRTTAPAPTKAPPAAQAPAPPVVAAPETGAPAAPFEEAEAKAFKEVREARVINRKSFNDQQEAAARPGDYVLDPAFRGFIPIPNTVYMVKFNPKPRLNMMFNTKNPGDAKYRFAPALFALKDDPRFGDEEFDATANGSQLRVDLRAPSMAGNPRIYYQNDFFGSDTAQMRYRLQHLYGSYYGLVGGFTYGIFEDPDSWPDTVDYEGPNSLVFARRPLLHYIHELAPDWTITGALESPQIQIDTDNDPGATQQQKAPDAGFALRWTPGDIGHVRFATIGRALSAKGGAFGEDHTFGWGMNLSGSLAATSSDTVQFVGIFGEGIGGLGNDAGFQNTDAAFNSDGDLQALTYVSGMAALTHRWTPRWRSTGTFGYVHIDNTSIQVPTAYHVTHYASLNLMYQVFKRVTVGVEGLYGFREVKSGNDTSDVFRVDLGLVYSPFD
jgi:hypothetical protein